MTDLIGYRLIYFIRLEYKENKLKKDRENTGSIVGYFLSFSLEILRNN